MGSLATVLLQMFSWFWQWNKFGNRSIFDKVKAYQKRTIFGHPVFLCYKNIALFVLLVLLKHTLCMH